MTDNILTTPKSKWLSAAILLCIAVLYSVMSGFVPYQLDDLTFQEVYLSKTGYSCDFSLNAWWEYISEIRAFDNSRISNILAPFSSIIVPWRYLFPFFTGVLIAAIVWLAGYFVAGRRPSPAMLILVWAPEVLFLPWRNFIFVADYSLNYIYSGAVTLLTVWLMLRYEFHGHSRRIFCLLIPLAVLAGGWHEGFALPTIAALFILTTRRKFSVSRGWWIIGIIYFVSACLFGISPGMINRFANEHGAAIPNCLKLTADLILPLILLLVAIALLAFHKGRAMLANRFSNDVFTIFFSAALISSVLSLAILHNARSAFYPSLCSIIALLLLVRPLIDPKISGGVKRWVCLFLTVCLIAHGVASIIWQSKYYFENKEIMQKIEAADGDTVFYDIILPEEIPLYTLYFPAKSSWVTEYHYTRLVMLTQRDHIAVVPTSLRHATPENSVKVGDGIFKTDDALFGFATESGSDRIRDLYFDVTLSDGTVLHDMFTFASDYTSESGARYVYYKIYKISAADVTCAKIAGSVY